MPPLPISPQGTILGKGRFTKRSTKLGASICRLLVASPGWALGLSHWELLVALIAMFLPLHLASACSGPPLSPQPQTGHTANAHLAGLALPGHPTLLSSWGEGGGAAPSPRQGL